MRTKEQIIADQASLPGAALVLEVALDIRDALVDIASAIREHPSFAGIAASPVNPNWHKKNEFDGI